MTAPLTPPSLSFKRILICPSGLSRYQEDKVQLGIRRFALSQPDWRIGYLHASEVDEAHLSEVLTWKPDGILVVCRPSEVPQLLDLEGIPKVITDLHHEHVSNMSRVEVDDRQLGQIAADFFLSKRFEYFAAVRWPGNPVFSQIREEGFHSQLQTRNFTCGTFEIEHGTMQPWYRNEALESWLDQLPKPVGIYCVNDLAAMRILELCDSIGIRIPAEVSVVGTDNNIIICESVRPFISSIPQPLEQVGFRAAEILWEQIRNQHRKKKVQVVTEMVEPGQVEERQSTSLRALPDPAIAKAANYLHNHAIQGATIGEAAKEAGINRRALERGFKKHLGVTPGGYVREVKIEHAKRLLAQTDLRMWEIAEACKMTQEHFATFFRKSTGESPSTYRRRKKNPGRE